MISQKIRSVKKLCITLSWASWMFSAQCIHAQDYALVDLYRLTLERSERIRASKEDVFIAEREKERARASFLPTVSAFGSYTRFSENKYTAFGSANLLLQSENAASWGVGFEQGLSLGGKEFAAYRIAQADIERSNLNLDTVRESNLLTVATSYYDFLRAKKSLEIAASNVERLSRHRDAAVVRLRVGEVTKTDQLRAEAELSGAKSELVRAQNMVKLAKAVLARVVGISNDFEVREPGAQIAEASLTHDGLRETAFNERTELKSYALQKKMAEERIYVAKSAYWPTISVEGGYLGQTQDPSLPISVDDSKWVGIRLNIPIFEGGIRKAEVGQAEAKARQSALIYDDARKTVALEVDNSWLDYQTQQGVLQSLSDQLKFASDNFYSVSKQYNAGLANSIDVIDANTLLLTAERQVTEAEFNYQLSMVRLQRSMGVLLKTVK